MGRLAAIVALVGALACPAWAQVGDAEAAFRRGRALMSAGKVDQACQQFALSLSLDPQHGTRYNLALCHEAQGKTATAWAEMKQLATEDTNPGRRAEAARRAEALGKKTSKLVIVAPARADGLVVRRDGIDVTAQVGKPEPIDPGTYKLEATATGRTAVTWDVEVVGEGKTIRVEIPGETQSAGAYPRELPLRTLALPSGVVEGVAALGFYDSPGYVRDPLDLAVSARIRLGWIELGGRIAFNLRDPGDGRDVLQSAGLGAAYVITPDFLVGASGAVLQPTQGGGSGIEVQPYVTRKVHFRLPIAAVGRSAFDYQRLRSSGGGNVDLFAIYNRGSAQVAATKRLSAELWVDANLYLAGELKPDHVLGLGSGLLAMFSVTPKLDVWASAFLSIYPTGNGYKAFVVGASQRLP